MEEALLPSFLLSVREGLEAALIIGIVLGALKKIGRPELKSVVWAGTFSAIGVSLACAIFLTAVGATLQGQAEEVFEGFTMFLAAGVLTWMIFWMNSQSRNLRNEIEIGVQQASLTRGKRGLFFLAFILLFHCCTTFYFFTAITIPVAQTCLVKNKSSLVSR